MRRAREFGSGQGRWIGVALALALVVGLLGIYPHVRWSAELKHLAWFFNSYDEGYYGWLSMHEFALNRGLSAVVMHGLFFVSGSNAQLAMILADFFLPAAAVLACCYMVRPLFTSATGMAAAALTVLVSAECLALRSTSLPYAGLHTFLATSLVPLTGGPAGIFQLENQTSTFWIFRTPEPQVSWIIMYLSLGVALRLVLDPIRNSRAWLPLALLGIIAGTGYLFCALSVGGALVLFAVLVAHWHARLARVLGGVGLLYLVACLGLAFWSARQWGGESLLFASHRPVFTIGSVLGLLFAALAALRGRGEKPFSPLRWFAIALGVAPTCMANQQIVTGHMIYLLNFENFAFAQFAALAALIALSPIARGRLSSASDHVLSWAARLRQAWFPLLVSAVLVGLVVRSQLLSYQQYWETNRVARSYAVTLRAIPRTGSVVVCDDFFATDILTMLLDERPDFLLARDMTFTDLLARLKNAQDLPPNGAKAQKALFQYLALTGVTPGEFARRFDAITDPGNPNWEDRFLLGGFLYNYADFWAPLTHGRDIKIPWIKAQKARIVEAYAQFLLQPSTLSEPVVFVMREDKPPPSFLAAHHAQLLRLPPIVSPLAMKAYRLEGIGGVAPAH